MPAHPSDLPVASSGPRRLRNEIDVIRANYRFIPDGGVKDSSWESRLTQHYSSHLFRRLPLLMFSPDKRQIGLRWRTEAEVRDGKGDKICANITCNRRVHDGREVNFKYNENEETKETLVKVMCCKRCVKRVDDLYGHRERRERNDAATSESKALDERDLAPGREQALEHKSYANTHDGHQSPQSCGERPPERFETALGAEESQRRQNASHRRKRRRDDRTADRSPDSTHETREGQKRQKGAASDRIKPDSTQGGIGTLDYVVEYELTQAIRPVTSKKKGGP